MTPELATTGWEEGLLIVAAGVVAYEGYLYTRDGKGGERAIGWVLLLILLYLVLVRAPQTFSGAIREIPKIVAGATGDH